MTPSRIRASTRHWQCSIGARVRAYHTALLAACCLLLASASAAAVRHVRANEFHGSRLQLSLRRSHFFSSVITIISSAFCAFYLFPLLLFSPLLYPLFFLFFLLLVLSLCSNIVTDRIAMSLSQVPFQLYRIPGSDCSP
ncbi:hypothetical protein BDW74DRAFT_86052 [Aspergillus multicolor]|uniref:uncharacterized protein n=1 Tax=Aspergillus multicolor TaxID=41759 RepID=UPI003CCDE26B